jgi:hypothetical protein
MTGPDVLMTIADSHTTSGQVPPDLAESFRQMIQDAFAPGLTTSPAAAEAAQRPLQPHEAAAVMIVGTSLGFAKDKGDFETFMETIKVGIALAIKFGEYRVATAPG